MIGSGGAEQIRVYFSDDTFSTIKIDKCATAKEVCGQLMKKKKKQAAEFEQYFLFVSDFNPFLPISGLYCRKLEDEEVPYLVLMAVQKEGLLRNFKFVFKALEEEFDNHFLLRSMSYIGKKNPFKRVIQFVFFVLLYRDHEPEFQFTRVRSLKHVSYLDISIRSADLIILLLGKRVFSHSPMGN